MRDRREKKEKNLHHCSLRPPPQAHVAPSRKGWRATPNAMEKVGLWPPYDPSCTI